MPWPTATRMQIGVSASSSLTNVLSAVSGTPLLLGEGTALHQLDTEKATASEPWVKCDGAILCSAISLDGLVLATCQRLVLHTHYNRSDCLTPLTTFKVHHIPKSVAVARVATDIYAVAVGGADGALLRYICLNDNQTDTADWISQVRAPNMLTVRGLRGGGAGAPSVPDVLLGI